jgi:CAAX prenyl protease-like protein
MALFLGLTYLEGEMPQHYVWIYFAKVAVVGIALIVFRETWKDIRFEAKWILPAAVLGVVLCALWVWIEKQVQYPHFLGERTAFDPYASIADDTTRTAFIAVRLFGLAVLVPIMEELFWRSFLLRYASKQEFQSLRVGDYTWTGFAIVAALFGAAHPEWVPAVVFAVAMALLLRWTKSLFACIVAHAATNAALGAYVLTQRDWIFW